jgi:hypothetical protein
MVSWCPVIPIYHIASSPEFLFFLLQVNRNKRYIPLGSSVTENNSLDLVIYKSLDQVIWRLAGVSMKAIPGGTLIAISFFTSALCRFGLAGNPGQCCPLKRTVGSAGKLTESLTPNPELENDLGPIRPKQVNL